MTPTRGFRRVAGFVVLLVCVAAHAAFASAAQPAQWEQAAAALADQIAAVLGPGQARLMIRNNSQISTDDIPAIRRLLEQDLKARGIQASGLESANSIRVTLSENLRERLWVAEIAEGSETRVVMVHVDGPAVTASASQEQIVLRKERLIAAQSDSPILAALASDTGLLVLYPEKLVSYTLNSSGAQEQNRFAFTGRQGRNRDPRGLLLSSDRGASATAYLPGMQCTGAIAAPAEPGADHAEGSIHCRDSDDPWPIAAADSANGAPQLKAFYNAGRDYFTGVVTPSVGTELPPFYAAVLLPRSDGAGLLINGIDGKVQIVDAGTLRPVTGTRDWGSDIAAIHSGCGAGTQIIASGSGEALTDSLRAYELPAQEAIPASAPLAVNGTVTALATAPDGKSVFAVVRNSAAPGNADSYEVDRVTANCN